MACSDVTPTETAHSCRDRPRIIACEMLWLVTLLVLCSACPYNPQFYFSFDETSAPYVEDSGVINFPASPSFASVPGFVNRAVMFSTPTAGVATSGPISVSPPGSLAFWIFANSSKTLLSSLMRVVGWDGNHEFGLSTTSISSCSCSSGRLFPELFNSGTTGDAIPADFFDKWTFVSMSQRLDGTHVTYVDGRVTTCPSTTAASTTPINAPLYIGNRPGAAAPDGFMGALDELRWWDRELTEAEHMSLFLGCAPGPPPPAGPALPCRSFGTPAPPLPTPQPAPLPLPLPLPAPAPQLAAPSPWPAPLPFPLPLPVPAPLSSPLPVPLPSPLSGSASESAPEPSPVPMTALAPSPSPLAVPGPPQPAPLPVPAPSPLLQSEPQSSCIFANTACNGSQIIGTVVVGTEPVVVTTTLEILGDLYLNGQVLNFQLNSGGQSVPLIQVQGCAALDGTLTLDLSGIDASTLDGETYDLITSLCTTGNPDLSVLTNTSDCEDISASGATTGGTYTVTLHVDTSCSAALQTWQIALAAIGSFVVLVVLALILYLLCQPNRKQAEDEALEFELTPSVAHPPEMAQLGAVLEAADHTERSVRNLLNTPPN